MHAITDPWMKLKRYLNQADCDAIRTLYTQCVQSDSIELKLELEYKLSHAYNSTNQAELTELNEFMCWDADRLIGYIGICGFGGGSAPLEITGMVHPDYRRQGVFTQLHRLVMAECERRKAHTFLGLCDDRAVPGKEFLKKIGARYRESEFEMYLYGDPKYAGDDPLRGIRFQKATNADAGEVDRQNRIYFNKEYALSEEGAPDEPALLPEEEEKRGMTIWLAFQGERIVGKVNLVSGGETGAIYGLGVLPEYRGKGYGRAILLGAVQMLRAARAQRVLLQVAAKNDTALSLYQSCGFQVTSVMNYYAIR